jgi:hypothetical protein
MGLMYFEYLPILDAVMISYYLPYVFLNNYFKKILPVTIWLHSRLFTIILIDLLLLQS